MMFVLEPQPGYWDWEGSLDHPDPVCTVNNSVPINVDEELGDVIRTLVRRIRSDRERRDCPCVKERWSGGECSCAAMTLIDLSPD